MNRLLTDEELHAELRRKGLSQAKSFSWDKAASATLDVYRKVVEPESEQADAPESIRSSGP
jgi:glycosyltransferase involved in cell wall biosynthesis